MIDNVNRSNLAEDSGRFPDTQWSAVHAATQFSSPEGHAALDELLKGYHKPVVSYLEFKFSLTRHEAEDLWQSFVMRRILEKGVLARVDQQRGRFRTFLVGSLNQFVLSELRRQKALKRSPAGGSVSLDTLGERELAHLVTQPREDTELSWAQAVIAGALLNMRAECFRSGSTDVWGVFDQRVLSSILNDAPPTDYAELVRQFGFESPTQTFNALTTAKRMFRRHLRQVIAEYSAGDAEVEEELQSLKNMLADHG